MTKPKAAAGEKAEKKAAAPKKAKAAEGAAAPKAAKAPKAPKEKKEKKDGPKRPLSAYMLFAQDQVWCVGEGVGAHLREGEYLKRDRER